MSAQRPKHLGPLGEPILQPLHAFVGPNDVGKSSRLRYMQDDWDVTSVCVRFDADHLRKPSPLILRGEQVSFLDERGSGLAGVYDAILSRSLSEFQAIQDKVRACFPHIAEVGLANVSVAPPGSATHKVVAVTLREGDRLLADEMGDGLLYFLGFLALKHIEASMVLIEYPEHGFHPARIADVMGILRSLSESRQVILATHSPLVLNELQGNEITVLSQDDDNIVLLKDVPGFDDAMKVYQPGEFWLAHSDGLQDEALLTGRGRV